MKSEILNKLKEIKLFLFDLEGCVISKDFIYNEENENQVIEKLRLYCKEFADLNSSLGIITASNNGIVQKIKESNPCMIKCGTINKVELADNLLSEKKLDYSKVFFLGDDLLDIPLLQKCAVSAAPKDGRREVKRVVTFVTQNESGKVLEEIIDYFKQSKSDFNGKEKRISTTTN